MTTRFITIDLECALCGKSFHHQVVRASPYQALPQVSPSSRFLGIDLCRPCDEELFTHFTQLSKTKRSDGPNKQ